MTTQYKIRENPLYSPLIPFTPMVKTCVLYTSYKSYLFLKFIEVDEISVNLLHSYSKSDCHKLQNFQKFQETSTLHLMFQSMLW